jgi:hypothetical protein
MKRTDVRDHVLVVTRTSNMPNIHQWLVPPQAITYGDASTLLARGKTRL